ncbi:hypothetical protein [Halosimplex halobium]|uniref:hypothetical protein n=1 Tax=Halosimplex halobium TaxID=3396618 RepID=UPI003F56726A
MSLSDRERGEGFHRLLSSAVEAFQSERGEGFHRLLSSAVEAFQSERGEGSHHSPSNATTFDHRRAKLDPKHPANPYAEPDRLGPRDPNPEVAVLAG